MSVQEVESITLPEDATTPLKTIALKCRQTTVHIGNVGACILNYYQNEDDIVLGYSSLLEMYQQKNPLYFASIVGRVANRIRNGQFQLQQNTYQLPCNDPPHHLHGGGKQGGFSHQIWNVHDMGNWQQEHEQSIPFVTLSLDSPDGDQGYPGHVQVTATYSLRPSLSETGTTLRLEMKARLLNSISTPINLAQHSYFHLGRKRQNDNDKSSAISILDHDLQVEAIAYTPVDETHIPTRQVQCFANDQENVMDLSQKRKLRDIIREYGTQKHHLSSTQVEQDLQRSSQIICSDSPYGIDHNYVLRKQPAVALARVATLTCDETKRQLTVHASAPGVQIYTGNYLGQEQCCGLMKDKYNTWSGICLETQHFPDSIMEEFLLSEEAFAQGKCPILTPESPDYEHVVEYTLEDYAASAASTKGSNTEDCKFNSIDDMWAAQNMETWYRNSMEYYQDNCPSTLDGVLGNLGYLSPDDLKGSRTFLDSLQLDPDWLRQGTACECGAGIGRVSKGLLLDLCQRCDIVESCSHLLSAAPDYIGKDACRCRFFCTELQNWHPQKETYALIWIQWTAIYLTDADFVHFLRRCAQALVHGGVIVLKENTSEDQAFVVDVDDASLTRSLAYWRNLIYQTGCLSIMKESWQDDFPDDIFPVPMIALQRLSK